MKKKNYKKYLKAIVVLSFLFIQVAAFAQFTIPTGGGSGGGIPSFGVGGPVMPTAGNDPCTATHLKTGLSCQQFSSDTNITPTTVPAAPSCWADGVGKDVWFSFIATAQDMTVSTDAVIFELAGGTTNSDTELALYKSSGGACGSLVEIGCDQDSGINSGVDFAKGASGPTRQAILERTGLVVGDTYYLRVQGQKPAGGTASTGNFCVSAFDTYTVGSKPCEAQMIHPNNMACAVTNGNAVKNHTSSSTAITTTNTTPMQPNAYLPLGASYCGGNTAAQYGTWTAWVAEDASNITVKNNSPNNVTYTLFSGVCTNPLCITSQNVSAGASSTPFSGMVKGKKYYILTTLQGGATTDNVTTDLCITSSTVPAHPATEMNVGNVPGAGGTKQADHCPAVAIDADQVYKTTTYAADKDGGTGCGYGKNVWFTWIVPSTYPTVGGGKPAFFQMWSKNCNTGPGSPGTRLIVGASIIGDPCAGGTCLEFSSPSQTGKSGSSGDLDPMTAAATNVGWDAAKYGTQYWGMFQSGNDGVGDEVCDFNFMIGSTPSLKGITIADATICQGQSVTLTASGATAYEWYDGSTNTSITVSPTVNSSYTVTATAGADGYAIGYVTVIPFPFTVSATPGAICSGSSSATLTATSTSTLTTSYTWTPSTNLDVTSGAVVHASPPATKTYTVTGTIGANAKFAGCKASTPVTVTVGGSIPILVNNGTVCTGAGAVLTASGGVTYTWTPTTNLSASTGTSVTATPTATTTYTVTGENNGCKGTAQSVVTLSPTPTITVNSPTICSGQTATLTAAGGTTYTWSAGVSTTGTATGTVTPTVTTTYTVTGTSAGCSSTAIATVTVNAIPVTTVNSPTICAGATATMTAGGATTYTWSAGAISTGGAGATASPGVSSSFTVTGTTSGCSSNAVSNVVVNPSPITTVNSASICAGGTANLTAGGATTYVWSAGATSTGGANATAAPISTTVYTVTGTSLGCTATATSTVTVNPLPTITATNSTICTGLTASLTAGGGSTYVWSPGGSASNPFITPALSAQTSYTVTGTDVNGCVSKATATVFIASGLTVTVNNASYCPGGSATLTAAGGTTYSWSPSAGLSATVGNNIIVNSPTATTYTVTGNTNGCIGSAVSTISIIPLDDASFHYTGATFCAPSSDVAIRNTAGTGIYSISGGNLAINSGTGAISITAGTTVGPYVITLNTTDVCPNTYTVGITVTANPSATFSYPGPYCKNATPNPTIVQPAGSSPGNFTATPAGLAFVSPTSGQIDLTASAPGNYTVTNTIPAGNGCNAASATATVVINPSPATTASSITICSGTTGTLTAGGATTYSWSEGTIGATLTTPVLTATTTYTVTGTTAGCSFPATVTVTVNPNPVTDVDNKTICAGGSATLTASGATTYSWQDGSVFPTFTSGPLATTTSYTVTGMSLGCSSSKVGTITALNAPTVTCQSAAVCSGLPATLTANGATSYSWSSGQLTQSITVNPPTTKSYTVTGTIAGGCSDTAIVMVSVNPTPVVTISSTTVCAGVPATLTPAGATSYAWSDGSSGTSLTVNNPQASATYTVIGSSGGCTAIQKTATITVNPIPTVIVDSKTICAGDPAATLTASGATAYVWSPNIGAGNTGSASPIITTTYTVTGTSAGCTGLPAVGKITVNPLPNVSVNSTSICAGLFSTLTASGAATYSWLPGGSLANSITVNPTIPTQYTVTGTLGGCSKTAVGLINAYPLPQAAFTPPLSITLSAANISFDDKSTNANAWFWNFGDTTTSVKQNPQHQYADTGLFKIMLKVISNGGCTDSVTHTIKIVPDVLVYIPNAFTPDGDDLNDGFSFKGAGIGSAGFEFRIFDRWGLQLFYTTDINAQWKGDYNGVPCPQDMYVYVVVVKDNFGKEKKYLGNVTLVR